MKHITYKRAFDREDRSKLAEISSVTEDSESITSVRKSFQYHVSPSQEAHPEVESPQVYIVKEVNAKKKSEKFDFQVRGSFFICHENSVLEVKFHHTLHIEIQWKAKHFSPKKSEVLT